LGGGGGDGGGETMFRKLSIFTSSYKNNKNKNKNPLSRINSIPKKVNSQKLNLCAKLKMEC